MDIKLTKRSYAVGIQEFEHFRTKGSVYIDKTSYVWKMVSADAKNFFLSRPRRFGKSLLISTLHAYFEGRKELFEGLAISQREKDWIRYPVIRLNLSAGKYYELDRMHSTIDNILDIEEKRWNVDVVKDPYSYDTRLTNIILAAYKQTGREVVVLVDEYDAPMLDSVKNPDLQDKIRDLSILWD